MQKLNSKMNKLINHIRQYNKVMIAYSGGVDSTFLVKASIDALGKENVIAAIWKSFVSSEQEFKKAIQFAKDSDFNLHVIEYSAFEIPEFARNDPQRCYFCKRKLFESLTNYAKSNDIDVIFDGTNYDDLSDNRPGMQAAEEFGVQSPLKELSFTKSDIRNLAKHIGLSNWNKPSTVCFATRFPYGTHITPEKVEVVSKAEDFLRSLNFNNIRVRYHDEIARIEVDPGQISAIVQNDLRAKIVSKFKQIGFTYVTFDLEGFRSGSLNESIKNPKQIK
jgi:uncharacterized protein